MRRLWETYCLFVAASWARVCTPKLQRMEAKLQGALTPSEFDLLVQIRNLLALYESDIAAWEERKANRRKGLRS